jgi:aspartyl-tRNA synthetase
MHIGAAKQSVLNRAKNYPFPIQRMKRADRNVNLKSRYFLYTAIGNQNDMLTAKTNYALITMKIWMSFEKYGKEVAPE